jgi:hypothetical protein
VFLGAQVKCQFPGDGRTFERAGHQPGKGEQREDEFRHGADAESGGDHPARGCNGPRFHLRLQFDASLGEAQVGEPAHAAVLAERDEPLGGEVGPGQFGPSTVAVARRQDGDHAVVGQRVNAQGSRGRALVGDREVGRSGAQVFEDFAGSAVEQVQRDARVVCEESGDDRGEQDDGDRGLWGSRTRPPALT